MCDFPAVSLPEQRDRRLPTLRTVCSSDSCRLGNAEGEGEKERRKCDEERTLEGGPKEAQKGPKVGLDKEFKVRAKEEPNVGRRE